MIEVQQCVGKIQWIDIFTDASPLGYCAAIYGNSGEGGTSHLLLARVKNSNSEADFVIAASGPDECSPGSQTFKHSEDSPADLGTRGISVAELKSSRLWWNGPEVLQQRPAASTLVEDPPKLSEKEEKFTITEQRGNLVSVIKKTDEDDQPVINLERHEGPPVTEEVGKGFQFLVKQEQRAYFTEELAALESGETVPKNSSLNHMRLILREGVIMGVPRTGGELVVLPSQSCLTTILVRHAHKLVGHLGSPATVADIQRRFWIPGLRNKVGRAGNTQELREGMGTPNNMLHYTSCSPGTGTRVEVGEEGRELPNICKEEAQYHDTPEVVEDSNEESNAEDDPPDEMEKETRARRRAAASTAQVHAASQGGELAIHHSDGSCSHRCSGQQKEASTKRTRGEVSSEEDDTQEVPDELNRPRLRKRLKSQQTSTVSAAV
ncbi:unnamed protein product [Cyprideis torosa]|uniref:Integrase zinc-binding domain-containing protein n=1 Tax=Cyprideis torosa TaxID=163714 RepID=A0A7R8ZK31_9CRUS|nr:unnamed protein product [Cyprideis torosa]CAG0888432.1 unnamed protein product [Cyprideis torosa]